MTAQVQFVGPGAACRADRRRVPWPAARRAMRCRPARALRACACLLALCAAAAHAGWREDTGASALLGEGDVRFWGLHLYHARLWSGAAPFDPARPYALELVYARPIAREHFVDASIAEMRRLGGASEAQLGAWRAALARAFIDVRAGDRLVGAYLPGEGLRLYHGEQPLARVADPALAQAFFGIWLDARTREPALRARLLGLRP